MYRQAVRGIVEGMSIYMRNLVTGSLLLAAAGIGIQIAAGVHYGVPVGVLVFVAAAALVWWRPRRWTAAVALLVGLFIGMGAIATPNTSNNLSSPHVGIVAATVLQTATLVVVIAAGLLAVARPRHRSVGR
jgi:Na+-translocating ferredoxin:NAD+ oxidoreductase RnfD subunit